MYTDAIKDWDREVSRVRDQLIEGGMPPYDAADRARQIVTARRRDAARKNADKLPADVRAALLG